MDATGCSCVTVVSVLLLLACFSARVADAQGHRSKGDEALAVLGMLEQAVAEGREEDAQGLYREDLDKLVHGLPWREYDEQRRTEVFTWRGIRAHRLRVQYGGGRFVQSYATSEADLLK